MLSGRQEWNSGSPEARASNLFERVRKGFVEEEICKTQVLNEALKLRELGSMHPGSTNPVGKGSAASE